MEKFIKIRCSKCDETFSKDQAKVIEHVGKTIGIRCSKCQAVNMVLISEDLLAGTLYDPNKTFILSHSSNNSKLVFKTQQSEFISSSIISLKKGKNILGRFSDRPSEFNKVNLDTSDRTLSRNHCEVFLEVKNNLEYYILKDFQSKTGTFLNYEKLHKLDEIYLQSGDVVQIGNIEISVSEK